LAVGDDAKTYEAPVLHGRHVYLRATMPEDYSFLRQMETSSPIAHRWRFRGAVPSPEEWAQASSQGMLAQFMVVEQREHRPIGIVYFYNPSFQDGFAWLAAARFGPPDPSPLMTIGIGLGVNYAFTCWNLRKLYMEVPEYNYSQFASSAARWCEIEGHLRGHWYFDGQLWDVLTLALYRDRWMTIAPKLLAAEQPESASPDGLRGRSTTKRRVVVKYQ
jgi:RimJ/RimL family protein N-acetyltransferase